MKQSLTNLLAALSQYDFDRDSEVVKSIRYADFCLRHPVSPDKILQEALTDLVDSVPKQTQDADWWSVDLIEAMQAAETILETETINN